LREGVEQKQAVMLGVLAVVTLTGRDKFNWDQRSSLMQQLEDRMLGVRARSAPGDRRAWTIEGAPVRRYGFAVRLHF
jgi:hypothetical protein